MEKGKEAPDGSWAFLVLWNKVAMMFRKTCGGKRRRRKQLKEKE